MSTLQTKFGITWSTISVAGKAAFVHGGYVVAYSLRDGKYHLVRTAEGGMQGRSIHSCKSAGDCLEESGELIMNGYADAFIPSWDDEDSIPDTERYPHGYVPNWKEAA
jgi:hypothetical protein